VEAREPDCWCRLEIEGGSVRRVHVMHPNGEILFSYPPETFSPELLARMRVGQIRGCVQSSENGEMALYLKDASGRIVFSDRSPAKTAR